MSIPPDARPAAGAIALAASTCFPSGEANADIPGRREAAAHRKVASFRRSGRVEKQPRTPTILDLYQREAVDGADDISTQVLDRCMRALSELGKPACTHLASIP
jgi:hypothetical protein